MAKFLDTTGVSHYLQQLINNANERLILISPYLKINERIKQSLEDKNLYKIDIRVVYGKNELQPEENNWLKSMTSIRSSFCKDLHAKCYLNENQAIITSMNLYEFSQVNNNEMGILVDKEADDQLYKDIYEEVQRLIRNSDEIIVSVEKAIQKNGSPEIETKRDFSKSKYRSATALSKSTGVPFSKVTEIFIETGIISVKGKDTYLTPKGKSYGGVIKNGQYGEYIAWPEEILELLSVEQSSHN